MPRKSVLGEFEQLVLLAALRLRGEAYAPVIARTLEERAERELSRGTLYAALDRLESRGLITWEAESATESRTGNPRRPPVRQAVGNSGATHLQRHLVECGP